MDEIGMRYQALALRIGRHVPDYVDFWIGGQEMREAIDGEVPAPPEELHVEAVAMHEAVATQPVEGEAAGRRREWLLAQLDAMSATVRLLAGEEIAFAELVEALFDMPAGETPDEDVRRAHAVLHDVLPGGPSLLKRLAAHERATTVPADRLVRSVEWMAQVLRRRTREDVGLPEGESVAVVAAGNPSSGDSAIYLGNLRTRIEVNLDLPATLGTVVHLAGHEAYPGHHVERASKEIALWRARELGEAAVACSLTPASAISEGMADIVRGVVLTDGELGSELRDLVRALDLPIAAADAEREVEVGFARDLLRDLGADAALAMHQHGRPEAEVRTLLAERALWSPELIDHKLRTLHRDHGWAALPFAYTAGRRLIGPWLESQGQTAGLRRLLTEQLTPGRLRAELGEPAPLFPGSLV